MEKENIKQYRTVKQKHSDVLLLFRGEDTYEAFEDDAVEVSRTLNIPLKEEDGVRYTSFPAYEIGNSLRALVKRYTKTKRVAICERTVEPKQKRITEKV